MLSSSSLPIRYCSSMRCFRSFPVILLSSSCGRKPS
jgi:hypothetical protein